MNKMNENDILLNNILNLKFFNEYKDTAPSKDENSCSLELQITADCNLKCKYCYLTNFGDKLYPLNIRNHKCILDNLNIVLNWIKENKYILKSLDLFSGEIWYNKFGTDVLDIIYEHLKENKFTSRVVIPSNASFLIDDKATEEIQKRIDLFKSIGVKLIFSLSIDGKVVEDNIRPFKDNEKYGIRNDEYYDRVFKFAVKNNYGFHPMVSAGVIEKWIENYNWWINMSSKYHMDISKLMMLEVRNNDWTDDKIKEYIKFLNYVIDYKYKNIFKYDKVKFACNSFGLCEHFSYNNTELKIVDDRYGCKVQESLYIRLGDLTLTPCHRTSYEKFNYGKLAVENNKIVGITAYNPELAIKILCGNPVFIQLKCGSCHYNKLCMNGCLGSQYENSGEIFFPCDTVCNLFIEKSNFLIDKYESMGLFEVIENPSNYEPSYQQIVKDFLIIKDKINMVRRGI